MKNLLQVWHYQRTVEYSGLLTFPRKDLIKTLNTNSGRKYLHTDVSYTDNLDNVCKKRKAINCFSCLN